MSIGVAGLVYTAMVCSAGTICQDIGWLQVMLNFFFTSPSQSACLFGVLLLISMVLFDFGEGIVKVWINIGKWSARQTPRTDHDKSFLPLGRWAQCLCSIPWQEISADVVNQIWDPLVMSTLTLAFRDLSWKEFSNTAKGCWISLLFHCTKWAIHAYEDVYLPLYPRTYPRRFVKRPVFAVVFAIFFLFALYIHWELVSFSIPATWRWATAYRHGQGYSVAGNKIPGWMIKEPKRVYAVTTKLVTKHMFTGGTVTPPAKLLVY